MGFAGMINTYGMDYTPIPYLWTSKTVRLSVFFHMTFWPNRRMEYLQLAWWWKPCFLWLITPLILGLRPTCNWDTTHLETGAFHQVSKSKIPSWAVLNPHGAPSFQAQRLDLSCGIEALPSPLSHERRDSKLGEVLTNCGEDSTGAF